MKVIASPRYSDTQPRIRVAPVLLLGVITLSIAACLETAPANANFINQLMQENFPRWALWHVENAQGTQDKTL